MTATVTTTKRRSRLSFGRRVPPHPEASGQHKANDKSSKKKKTKAGALTTCCPEIIDKLIALQSSSSSEQQEKQQDERRQDNSGDLHSRDYDLYQLCREATEACLREIISHLYNFLQDCDNCDAKYEDWIKDVHPENVDGSRVDHRFYIKDSEHLGIWNALMETLDRESKIVSPRSLLQRQDSFTIKENTPRQ
jgi:hypothetical protein